MAKAVKEIKAGKVEYRLDKTNIIHCPIGKVSFGAEKLTENFNALMGAIIKAKPSAAKGQYVRSCVTRHHHGPRREDQRREAGVRSAEAANRGAKEQRRRKNRPAACFAERGFGDLTVSELQRDRVDFDRPHKKDHFRTGCA